MRSTGRGGTAGSSARAWRYPGFGPQAADLGVRSAVSLPLDAQGGRLGALNDYAHRPRAFADTAVRVATAFAAPAAVVLANARVLEASQRLTAQMREAMVSRAVIEQAKGILMARHAISADEAFLRLRHASQVQHVKLHAVAQGVVHEAVGLDGRVRG